MTGHTKAPASSNQLNGDCAESASEYKKMTMNPYETNPELISTEDPYISRSVYYGRYAPRDDDFRPLYNHWHESEPESASYWEDIVKKFCTPENSLNVPGTREAFAAGSVIIRVDCENMVGAASEIYSCINANELCAARKAEDALKEIGVAVPVIYFCGTVEGRNVTVESRIPGVSLEVAWKYLTAEQVKSFKQQCRHILQRLGAVDFPEEGPSYVCGGLNSQLQPNTEKREREILFEQSAEKDDLCFVHNDMVRSNIIINDDRVVGLLGWRQCGLFGHERARKVHRQLRIPEPTFISGDEDQLTWADLYDDLSELTKDRTVSESRDTSVPKVKTEPSTISLDRLPINGHTETPRPALTQLDGADITDEYPTPKKISNLKQEVKSRASSSERSSPVTSTKPATSSKKTAPATKKKGTATKKPAASKKRKRTDHDGDSVDGGRSNTPASSRASKTPAPKKHGSASVTGSPAPESKRKGPKNVAVEEGEEDEDYSDANEVFCICRKPDNHTWMIACDGGCEDWFHGKCVNIDPRDADLIDKYICKYIQAVPFFYGDTSFYCRFPMAFSN